MKKARTQEAATKSKRKRKRESSHTWANTTTRLGGSQAGSLRERSLAPIGGSGKEIHHKLKRKSSSCVRFSRALAASNYLSGASRAVCLIMGSAQWCCCCSIMACRCATERGSAEMTDRRAPQQLASAHTNKFLEVAALEADFCLLNLNLISQSASSSSWVPSILCAR